MDDQQADLPHAVMHSHGVELRRLRRSDIEQVRLWRNSPQVRRWMEFRDTITPQMQEQWFAGLDPARQFFFVVLRHGRRSGVVNVKNVDWPARSGEGGIFLSGEADQDGLLGMRAGLSIIDFAFNTLGLRELAAHMMTDNPRILRFNKMLGYKIDPGQGGVANKRWTLTPEDYEAAARPIRKILSASP